MSIFFREVLNEDLGCASYVVADSGEAAIIDPKSGRGDVLGKLASGTRASRKLDFLHQFSEMQGQEVRTCCYAARICPPGLRTFSLYGQLIVLSLPSLIQLSVPKLPSSLSLRLTPSLALSRSLPASPKILSLPGGS